MANLAAGQPVTFCDQFNRVTAINYPAFPANNVTYTYGAATQRQPGLVGNVVGRITHITDGAGTADRLYGPLGEIVKETRAIPIQGGQVPTCTTQFPGSVEEDIIQFLERCSGTFDLHGEIANADAFIRYCFEHAADAEAFHAQFAPAAEKAILKKEI
jgi:hypothetical protein